MSSATNDQSSPFSYAPAQTLLLFLDFHSLFVEQIGATEAATTAAKLKSWAKAKSIPVAHALIDDATDMDCPANIKGKDRTTMILDVLRSKKANFHEPEGIRPTADEDEIVFTRRAGLVSALTSRRPTDINAWLAEKGIKSLILAGLSSGGCTLRTATSATDAGYVVSVISDGCYDQPDTHKIVMEKLLPMRAHVFSLEDFTKEWEQKA